MANQAVTDQPLAVDVRVVVLEGQLHLARSDAANYRRLYESTDAALRDALERLERAEERAAAAEDELACREHDEIELDRYALDADDSRYLR